MLLQTLSDNPKGCLLGRLRTCRACSAQAHPPVAAAQPCTAHASPAPQAAAHPAHGHRSTSAVLRAGSRMVCWPSTAVRAGASSWGGAQAWTGLGLLLRSGRCWSWAWWGCPICGRASGSGWPLRPWRVSACPHTRVTPSSFDCPTGRARRGHLVLARLPALVSDTQDIIPSMACQHAEPVERKGTWGMQPAARSPSAQRSCSGATARGLWV